MRYFTDLDIEYIQHAIGRAAHRNELKIIHEFLYPVLKKRAMLPRSYVDQITAKKNQPVQVISETRFCKDGGAWQSYGALFRNFALSGLWPEHLAYIWTFFPPKTALKRLQAANCNNSLGVASFSHHIIKIANRSRTGRVIIIGMARTPAVQPVVSPGWLIGKISIPRFGKTMMHEKRIYKQFAPFTSQLKGFSACGSPGNDLRKLLELVPDSVGLQLNFPSKYKRGDGILLLDHTLADDEGKFPFRLINDIQIVGRILPEPVFNIDFGDGSVKKWPRSIARITIHHHDDNQAKAYSKEKAIQRKGKKRTAISVMKNMIHKYMENSKKAFNQYLHKSDWNIYSNAGMMNVNDHQAADLGMRSVADAVRYLACLGTTVEAIQLNSNVANKNFLAGQLSVLEGFQLKNIGVMDLGEDIPEESYHVFVAGQSVPINTDIPVEGEFISLIGSLKGELGGSLYTEISGYRPNDNYPVMDVIMEYNVNQALVQLVQSKIVKWAQTVERGGLAMGLYTLYRRSGIECGLKIHMSMNLKAEEYLFGESFGAALVLLSGDDLMEYQRLCMHYSVPATTIGRVSSEKEITVNKDLKIARGILESYSTASLD